MFMSVSMCAYTAIVWVPNSGSWEVLNVASLAGETVKKPVNVVLYFISTDQN